MVIFVAMVIFVIERACQLREEDTHTLGLKLKISGCIASLVDQVRIALRS